jgi:hypothetical protein
MKTSLFTHWKEISDTTIFRKDYGHDELRCGGRFVINYMSQ